MAAMFTFRQSIRGLRLFAQFRTSLVRTFVLVARGPCFVTDGRVFSAFASRVMRPRRVAAKGAFSVEKVNRRSTQLKDLHTLLRQLNPRFSVFRRTNAASVLLNGLSHHQVSVNAVAFRVGLAFLALIIVSAIRRFLIRVSPFLRDGLLAVRTQHGVRNSRHHFSRRHAKATRQVSRVQFTFPTYFRSRANDWRLVRQDFHLIRTMAAFVRTLTQAISERHAIIV